MTPPTPPLMNTLEYLNSPNASIDLLVKEYNLKHKVQGPFNILNYKTQNDSRIISRECRGLVLVQDESTWKIAYNCMKRTFGEYVAKGISPESKTTIESCNLVVKVDGSFIKLFHHGDKWHLGTRSFASLDCTDTFVKSFLRGIGHTMETFQEACTKLDKNVSYMFETTGPTNNIVVKHTTYGVHFLNATVTSTGVPCGDIVSSLVTQVFPTVQIPQTIFKAGEFTIYQVEQYLEDSDAASPDGECQLEGFIAYNKEGEPLFKIKSARYYHLARLSSISAVAAAKALFLVDETPPTDQAVLEAYIALQLEYAVFVNQVERVYQENAGIKPQEYNNLRRAVGPQVFVRVLARVKYPDMDHSSGDLLVYKKTLV